MGVWFLADTVFRLSRLSRKSKVEKKRNHRYLIYPRANGLEQKAGVTPSVVWRTRRAYHASGYSCWRYRLHSPISLWIFSGSRTPTLEFVCVSTIRPPPQTMLKSLAVSARQLWVARVWRSLARRSFAGSRTDLPQPSKVLPGGSSSSKCPMWQGGCLNEYQL